MPAGQAVVFYPLKAYIIRMLSAGAVGFEVIGDLSAGDILTLRITAPFGRVDVQGEVEFDGSTLVLRGFNIEGVDIGAGALGVRALRELAQVAMEVFDVDTIRIASARRTSGAGRNRYTATLQFRRKR